MRPETILQQEIVLRLKAYPVIVCPIPNGLWIPARTPAERLVVAKIIASMKRSGQLVPGMPDLVLLWRGGCAAVELKASKRRDLLGTKPAGRLSDDQVAFAQRCAELWVNYACVTSWEQLRPYLCEWGIIAKGKAA